MGHGSKGCLHDTQCCLDKGVVLARRGGGGGCIAPERTPHTPRHLTKIKNVTLSTTPSTQILTPWMALLQFSLPSGETWYLVEKAKTTVALEVALEVQNFALCVWDSPLGEGCCKKGRKTWAYKLCRGAAYTLGCQALKAAECTARGTGSAVPCPVTPSPHPSSPGPALPYPLGDGHQVTVPLWLQKVRTHHLCSSRACLHKAFSEISIHDR